MLLRQLTELRMMSKAWAEKNKSLEPQDIKTKDENFAHRNANGTGPFMLKRWEPDVRTGAGAQPQLVGQAARATSPRSSTRRSSRRRRAWRRCCRARSTSCSTRRRRTCRACAQDPNLKVLDGAENRTIFFGMDQFRDELPDSNVKGKNPFKDVRVRKALYQAIDIDAIARRTMRGLAHARPAR